MRREILAFAAALLMVACGGQGAENQSQAIEPDNLAVSGREDVMIATPESGMQSVKVQGGS